jgi:hypothetical protein
MKMCEHMSKGFQRNAGKEDKTGRKSAYME